MGVRRLRRRCERILAGIPVPRPFDLAAFCQGIAHLRGRALRLQPVPGLSATAPCGLWISLPDTDYIVFDPDTSRLHAEHIVLHELGHMLCGHSISMDLGSGTLARLMPDLDPKTVARVLGRVSYPTAQEQEAELLASLIRTRAAWVPPGESGGDALGRLADVLTFTA
jgi:hypothetical protein